MAELDKVYLVDSSNLKSVHFVKNKGEAEAIKRHRTLARKLGLTAEPITKVELANTNGSWPTRP